MKRFAVWAVGLFMASAVLVIGSQTVAQANVNSDCVDQQAVCLDVLFTKDSLHEGINVDAVNLWCDANHWATGWDNPAVDGHGLTITNVDTGNVLFRLDDAHSNVTVSNGSCARIVDVNLDRPHAHHFRVYWFFTEQINLWKDYDYAISIDIYNN